MNRLWRDLRYSFRVLRRRPIFTFGAVASIALAVAANVTIFTYANALLLNPLEIEEPDRLAFVHTVEKGKPRLHGVSHPNYLDYKANNSVFSELIVFRPLMFELAGGDGPVDLIRGEMVSGNYFDALQVPMAHGRAFGPDEDRAPGAAPVVVISHRLWENRFGADPDIIGSTLRLNGHPFTVIGVAQEGFQGVYVLATTEFWVPTMMYTQALSGRRLENFNNRAWVLLNMAGRLAPGVDLPEAESEMKALAANLEREYPNANENLTVAVRPATEGAIVASLREGFVLGSKALFALVGLLLLIAIANVANLLLARALERRKEVAVRLSQGADRGDLLRQLLIEGLTLSFLGGAVGCVLAAFGLRFFQAIRPPMIPETLDLSPDLWVVGFTVGLCVFAGLVFGLVPALQAFRTDLVTSLKDEMPTPAHSSRKLSLRNALAVLQVAMAGITLLGTGLFLVSVDRAFSLDLGFDTETTSIMSFDLGARGYEEPEARAFQERALRRAGAVPGARRVALAERAMLDPRATPSYEVTVVGQEYAEDEALDVRINTVSPHYFDTMGISLLTGREFNSEDRQDSPPVVVINETMAQRLWPGESPLGRQVRIGGEETPYRVIGVAEDGSYQSVVGDSGMYMYRSHRQAYTPAMTLHVSAEADPALTMEAVRREVQGLDPELPWIEVRTMESQLESSLWKATFIAGMFSFFGVVSLLISMVGIYSVTSLVISARRQELGIRMALGADRFRVRRLIVKFGLSLALVGTVLGVIGTKLLTPYVESLLYGVSGSSLLLDLLIVAGLLAITFVTTLIAVRPILRIHPHEAIRST